MQQATHAQNCTQEYKMSSTKRQLWLLTRRKQKLFIIQLINNIRSYLTYIVHIHA